MAAPMHHCLRLAMCAMLHTKCRSSPYTRTSVQRLPVPDNLVPWSVSWPEYAPEIYTSPSARGKPWADPDWDDPGFAPKWNSLDGKVDRSSHLGEYGVDHHGRPLNPRGRTGLAGRGHLGRWGPNHAADPIVTRFKPGDTRLQFVAIKRGDTGEWAIPGGMVDPGENVSVTLKREFMEEALNSLELSGAETMIGDFFSRGVEVYRGYVDDTRNTDNAWMETVAVNYHDATGNEVGSFKLNAGDDAVGVKWMDVTSDLKLYASHAEFIQKVAQMHGVSWCK